MEDAKRFRAYGLFSQFYHNATDDEWETFCIAMQTAFNTIIPRYLSYDSNVRLFIEWLESSKREEPFSSIDGYPYNALRDNEHGDTVRKLITAALK